MPRRCCWAERAPKDDVWRRIGGDEFVVVCLVEPRPAPPRGNSRPHHPPDAAPGRPIRATSAASASASASPVETTGRPRCRGSSSINADMRLYRAGSRGRNRHEFFSRRCRLRSVRNKKVGRRYPARPWSATSSSPTTSRSSTPTHWKPAGRRGAGPLARTRPRATDAGRLPRRPPRSSTSSSTIDRGWCWSRHSRISSGWDRPAAPRLPRISVNVSARRLSATRTDQQPASSRHQAGHPVLRVAGIDLPRQQTDEIVTWNVDRIKEFGIDIEIDDFGTGHPRS